MTKHTTDIVPKATIHELVGHRDRCLADYEAACRLVEAANEAARSAAPGFTCPPSLAVVADGYGYRARIADFRAKLDAACWSSLMVRSGIEDLMGARQREEFRDQLDRDPPAFTLDNILATFADLGSRTDEIFRQSIIDVFERLPRSYKSHDGFKVGARIVAEYAVSKWGSHFHWYHSSHRDARDTLDDLDRIFHRLDGTDHSATGKATDIAAAAMQAGATEVETRFFRLRWFANGNLHVWFRRPDLVREMNRILSDHYGARLGWQHLNPDERARREACA